MITAVMITAVPGADSRDEAPIATLLENHRAFLRYLEGRVGDRALAEDILQDAFTTVVARPDPAPAGEAVIPWFSRSVRNRRPCLPRARSAEDTGHRTVRRLRRARLPGLQLPGRGREPREASHA